MKRINKLLLVLPLSILLIGCNKKTSKNTTEKKPTSVVTTKKNSTSNKTTTGSTTTVDNKLKAVFVDELGNVLKNESLDEGSALDLDIDTTINGKTFVGWYSNGVLVDSNTTISDDMIIVGKWKNNKYSLSVSSTKFDYSSYNGEYYYEETITVTAITRPYLVFVGWYDGNDNELSTSKTIDVVIPAGGITLVPKYSVDATLWDNLDYHYDGDECIVESIKDTSINPIIIPEGVTILDESMCFANNSIDCFILPDSVKKIEHEAFQYSGLKEIVLGSGLKTIEASVFEGTYLEYVFYHGTEEMYSDISIGDYNNELEYVVYFYAETKPATAGKYWHYVDDVPTIYE